MNPSRLFIVRPVATSLLMLALFLAGVLAYQKLPISALPQIDYPTIQVTTLYPGASQEVMAALVTAPLERQLGQLPGLLQMTSSSSNGASVITLQFILDLNLDIAEQEVQAAINSANNFLPGDLPMPPIYSKVNPADAPVVTLAVSSSTRPLPKVEDLVETRLAQKLAQLSGVGMVTLSGGQRPAVRIQANPTALAAYGLSLEDLRTAIANANVNQPKGFFDGTNRAAIIDANDQLRSAQEYAALIIAYKNGAPVRLSDVADARDATENTSLAAWADQSPAVIVNIQRQPGSNIISVVDRIQQVLPQLRAGLPADLEIKLMSDRTATIRASVQAVQVELLIALALVVAVIFLFLRNAIATSIPAVVVPLSLVGTFALMELAGFSINNLTLMALTIAAGFVVDDAIVVIENISRYLEQGDSPKQAALKGSEQIAFTIISLTVSLVAVLIPLLLMEEVVGRLFREFAITLAVAILISGLISLTLTPMMCALMLHPTVNKPAPASSMTDRFLNAMNSSYRRALTWVLDHQAPTLLVALGALVFTVVLFLMVPRGFFPVQDTGLIQAISEAPQAISFAAMAKRQQTLAELILADPSVASVSSFIGVDGMNPTLNTGRLLINLKPLGERHQSISQVMAGLKDKISDVPGIGLYMQPVQDLTIENKVSRNQYQFSLDSADKYRLAEWADKFIARLGQKPEFSAVAGDAQTQGRQAYVNIDRNTASRLGVTIADIDNILYSAFGQRLISTIFTQSNQYRVVLEVKPEFKQDLEDVKNLRVPSSSGSQIPLSALATVSERPVDLVSHRLDQFPSITISFDLAHGASLDSAIAAIEAVKKEIALPTAVALNYQGTLSAFNASLGSTLWLILAAIVTVYIVLGVLYESYIHPLTILSTLPSAAVGALLALILSGNDLGIIAVIGIILLIGIVKKNAILMIDFAIEAERNDGLTAREAIFQAGLLRFRPIMMTTMAALFSALPLMLGTGVGSELRHPLGITLVGGLIVSQMLTLFTTPVIYLAFDRLANGGKRKTPASDEATL